MSDTTVFYAWQSDTPGKVNKNFIRRALDDAVKQLQRDAEVEDAPRLDHDTKDEPGMPDIPATIRKKIAACAVFVADVTLVAETSAAPPKKVPNPNVMLELGYAMSVPGPETLICVMNTAFGGPKDLPFDLQSRRHPIEFKLASPDATDAAQVRKELTEKLAEAIRMVLTAPDSRRQRAREEEAAARIEVEGRMKRERVTFEKSVRGGHFHGFKSDSGVVAISLIPERRDLSPLRFSEPRVAQSHLWAISGQAGLGERHAQYSVFRDQAGDVVFGAVELREDGCVLTADGYLLGRRDVPEHFVRAHGEAVKGCVPSGIFELRLLRSVCHNLATIRTLGVQGPVYCGITLFAVRGLVMPVDSYGLRRDGTYAFSRLARNARICQKDSIELQSVAIPDRSPVITEAEAAQVLKQPFDQIWLEFVGVPSPNFTDGRWNPVGG